SDGTWQQSVVDPEGVGLTNRISVDGEGNVAILYHHIDAEPPQPREQTLGQLKLATNEGSGWSVRTLVAGPRVGRFLAMRGDGRGVLHIVYFDEARGTVVYRSVEDD
ncbi:MAG: hypothetical protein ABEN55_10545, partial [Bradymonadaceae bacterium]